MKSKIVWNLVLVLALIALGLYAYMRPKQGPVLPSIKVTALNRDEIKKIMVERRGSPAIRLERRNGTWQITAPISTLADSYQVDRLLDMSAITAKQKLPLTDPGRFDLDPAPVRVTLNEQVLAFGRINDITNEQYLATGDGIYLVPPFYGYGVPNDVNALVNRKLLDETEIPVGLDFGKYRITRNERGEWTTEGAFPAQKDKTLSQDDFNRWADEWRHTSALAAEPHKGPRGTERVTLRFKNGKTVILQILQRQPDFQMVRGDSNIRYRFGADVGRRLLDPYAVAQK
jgi:hypothetical protein